MTQGPFLVSEAKEKTDVAKLAREKQKKEIKEKRRKYEHSSLSSVEEKKILREIDLLK